MDYIKFRVKYTRMDNQTRVMASIHNMESSFSADTKNEVPIILDILAQKTSYTFENNNRFPYRFTFRLS